MKTHKQIQALLETLSENTQKALPYLFEIWANLTYQWPSPRTDWTTWLVLGGRGAGKTRTGAEWIRTQVEGARPEDSGLSKRIALVSETVDQARDVMVFGASGIMACTPPDRRPTYVDAKKQLVWMNGAQAQLFSAVNPEALRGPQFDCAWSDELAKWKKAEEAWDMLQFGLRLGEKPRQIVTTTPRPTEILQRIMHAPDTFMTRAATMENRANLAPDFLSKILRRYENSAIGRQEIYGEVIEDISGALWSRRVIEDMRCERAPALQRVVVAVDPPASSHKKSDACGIVVAGLGLDQKYYVLADYTVQGVSPTAWSAQVVKVYDEFEADRVIAEVNQGGDMVQTVLRQSAPYLPVTNVHASRGKSVRAEPIAALYEQRRVHHVGRMDALEKQMCEMVVGQGRGQKSPDRVDALVWALSALIEDIGRPQVRSL